MTTQQTHQLAQKIVSELPASSLKMVKHYIWLEANQEHRPDYSNLMNALKASATYAELNWVLSDVEIARLELCVLEMVGAK